MSLDRGVGAGGPYMLVPMAADVLAAVILSRWAGRRRTL